MTMLLRHRHRRSPYQAAGPTGISLLLQRAVVILVLAVLFWWVGKMILGLFGIGGSLNRLPASLATENRGLINVSLQGADLQVAEDGMMLFPGDALNTGPNAHASLKFFDSSLVRLDSSTDVTITESGQSNSTSIVRLTVKSGGLWIAVPKETASATGSVIHQIIFPAVTVDLPPGTEALLSAKSLVVYSAEGQGITVRIKGSDDFVVGEGQQWTAPAGDGTITDPYQFRSPLDGAALENPLLIESRRLLLGGRALASATSSVRGGSGGLLTLIAPKVGATISSDLVTVRGMVQSQAETVRVNGHQALLNQTTGEFSLDLAVPEGESDFEIGVEALDSKGTSIATLKRIVKIGSGTAASQNAAAPTVTDPAKTGETYYTNADEIVLRGKAPAGATGMQVNDYKLQLFNAEKGDWSYIASTRLGNMVAGSNTYDVVGVLSDGTKTPAARLTIVQGQGDQGVVTTSSAAGATSAAAKSSVSSVPLLTNDPLTPGILAVTGPTPGTTHTETGTGFLLEGKTSKQTDSIWINDYRLQLYKPGVTFWNYVADAAFANLKVGTNVYVIVARNAKGEVLDRLEYTVTYDPAATAAARSSRAARGRSSSTGQ